MFIKFKSKDNEDDYEYLSMDCISSFTIYDDATIVAYTKDHYNDHYIIAECDTLQEAKNLLEELLDDADEEIFVIDE